LLQNPDGISLASLVGPLVAALIDVSGFWPVMGAAEPPAWETKMARRTLTASVFPSGSEDSKSALAVERRASGRTECLSRWLWM